MAPTQQHRKPPPGKATSILAPSYAKFFLLVIATIYANVYKPSSYDLARRVVGTDIIQPTIRNAFQTLDDEDDDDGIVSEEDATFKESNKIVNAHDVGTEEDSREKVARKGRRGNESSWHTVGGGRLPIASNAAQIEELSENLIPFCVPWELSASDEWWTHHVEWEVFHEDDTHFCYRKIYNALKAKLFRKLYKRQFRGDCSKMISKQVISSGWGADFTVVADALMQARYERIPVQMQKAKWHYATPKPFKDDNPSACPSNDMFCYFLPISSCPAVETVTTTGQEFLFAHFDKSNSYSLMEEPNRWYLEFATRPQAWLRKRVYDFVKQHTTTMVRTPCTIIHVRRADVVLHDVRSRRYHKISEYLDASDRIEKNILLLTDDQNAISEAQHLHPEKHWMFLNRTRHRGSSGGWERQLPSNDPIFEVTVILGIFRLAQQCSSIIRSEGNFGNFIYGSMIQHNSSAWTVRLEDVQDAKVYSQENSKTVQISQAYDDKPKTS